MEHGVTTLAMVNTISVDNNGPGGSRSINFEATEPWINPKTNESVYNVALNIGNSDGYTGVNGLDIECNKDIILSFT